MTPKRQKALLALLTSPTREKAAATAGITSKTLRTYLADPEFQAEYRKAFSELLEDAVRQGQQSMAPALQVLREIAGNGRETGQVRVSAARSLLKYSLRLTEQLDLLQRLEELEKVVSPR